MLKKHRIIVAHIPVLHRGYINFFKQNPADKLCIVGTDILREFDYIRKDLRALTPLQAKKIILQSRIFENVEIFTNDKIRQYDKTANHIILPLDDISEYIAKKLKHAHFEFYPVFLRWDRRLIKNINKLNEDELITSSSLHKALMRKAIRISEKSTDIWRRVGAVLVTKAQKNILYAVNQGEPTPYSPWIEGDPRNIFKRGTAIEMSVFTHAEAVLIAAAARQGIKLEGAKIYVTTFPCPACAKIIAHSGIKTCYYLEGYSVLDGKRILNAYNVKTLRVKMDVYDKTHSATWVPYKKT